MALRLCASVLLAVGCVLVVQAPAHAERQGTAHVDTAACELPLAADAHPLLGRQETIARFEQLPPACLKAIVVACSEQANTGLMDLGSAAACSMGYEALLRRDFGGNFRALMAWWSEQRTGARPSP